MSEPTKSRRAAREAAFQAAYQCTVGRIAINRACDDVLSRKNYADEIVEFITELADGMVTRTSELDAKFAQFLKKGWSPDRLAVSDLLALRMAVFELYHFSDVPPRVTITEVVNIAKKYGDENSGKFVNGVLANVLEASPKKECPSSDKHEPTQSNPDESEPTKPSDSRTPEHEESPSWSIKSDD